MPCSSLPSGTALWSSSDSGGEPLLRARGAEGVDALRSAFAAAETPAEQAAAGLELARALESLTRNLDAVAVYQSALAQSDGGDEMQIRELEAGLAMAATQQSSTLPLAREVLQSMFQRPRRLDVADAIMRAIMAGGATMSRAVEGVAMAEAVLADGLIYDAEPSPVVGLALFPLVATDRMDAALAGWNEVIARATANAQPLLLAFGLTFRGTTLYRAGRLADAESDLRTALDMPSAMWVGSAITADARLPGGDRARPKRTATGRGDSQRGRPHGRGPSLGLPGQQPASPGARAGPPGPRPR